ncbi:MAG: ABC transporter ATP-binding protein, partial [Bacteroidales bacterium]
LVRIGRYPHTNLFGVLKEDDLEIVDKAIHFCGLENYKQTLLSHMSDGERQRAVLARVFAQDTGIMLLDEPTSFLDIPNKFEIFDLLRNLSENGKTIIFTTHDLNLATLYADKILLIHDRSIISGAPEDLYLRPELKSQFASNKLKMNSKTGEFIPHIHPDKKIILTSEPGCENAEIWTRKALTRKGYSVISSEKEKIEGNDSIDIYKEKDKFVWNLHRDKQNLLIPGIYELILKLENN